MEASEFNSKSWEELTDQEKIERQRAIIKGLQGNIN